jgi:hypothetical protein
MLWTHCITAIIHKNPYVVTNQCCPPYALAILFPHRAVPLDGTHLESGEFFIKKLDEGFLLMRFSTWHFSYLALVDYHAILNCHGLCKMLTNNYFGMAFDKI